MVSCKHMSNFDSIASSLLRPLDRVRWHLLKSLGPLSRPLVRRRELRIALIGVVTVTFALALTLGAPFWLLALGPVVWGVPHLLADVRYLVIRPGLHRRKVLCFAVGIPLLLAGCGFFPVYCGLVAVMMMAVFSRGQEWRKWTVAMMVVFLWWGAVSLGSAALIVFAHLHNFIAVMMWWFWRPRVSVLNSVPPLLFLGASLLIFSGWAGPWSGGFIWTPSGMGPDYYLRSLAPGIAEPWGVRLVLLFAFAQAVHYGVWLRLIPEDDRPQDTPRTFGASARAMRSDFGTVPLILAIGTALVFAIWATVDLALSRETYLRMALFHGFLELAAAAFLFVEGYSPIRQKRMSK